MRINECSNSPRYEKIKVTNNTARAHTHTDVFIVSPFGPGVFKFALKYHHEIFVGRFIAHADALNKYGLFGSYNKMREINCNGNKPPRAVQF